MSKSKVTYLAASAAVLAVGAVLLWQLGASCAGRQTVAVAPEGASAPPPAKAESAPSIPPAPVSAKSEVVDARSPSPSGQLYESNLMERLRKARSAGQHPLAIELAREGNRRFPASAHAPERHSILVHSLADNEQRSEARGEAEYMVNHYPDSQWVREIERFSGAHRHRNVKLNDAGEIEYY